MASRAYPSHHWLESAIGSTIVDIKKSTAWWELTQDKRRAIFAGRSHHIIIGLKYVARIARRLYHGSVSTTYIVFLSLPSAGRHGALTFMKTLR